MSHTRDQVPRGNPAPGSVEPSNDAATEAADGPAAGTIESPIAPDPGQAGDRNEEAARRGGPIDITPTRRGGGIG